MNLLISPNGHGKTNLLDAISLGSQLRLMRPIKQNSDLILFGESAAHVDTSFENCQVSIDILPEGKKVKINQKPTREAHALREKIVIVSFVPEDLGAVMGGASFRRRLLDQIAASLMPNYILYYRQYERVLLQRNRLLKQPLLDLAELDSFTQVLAQVAETIERMRLQALSQVKPFFFNAFSQLSTAKLSSNLNYLPSSAGDLKASLERLKSEERIRKTTLLGPHLDDLEIGLNDHAARFTASRGQARILILALKIAQLKAVFTHRQLTPMLLLDDVVGELDPQHAAQLLQSIGQLQAQTFITTTHLSTLPEDWQQNPAFHLQNGHADIIIAREGQ